MPQTSQKPSTMCPSQLGVTEHESAMECSFSLRACLKRSRSGCEMPHHQVDHGNPDPCFGGGGHGLEVFAQSLQAMEPAERAFHNPAPLQNLKALGVPGAFHDC